MESFRFPWVFLILFYLPFRVSEGCCLFVDCSSTISSFCSFRLPTDLRYRTDSGLFNLARLRSRIRKTNAQSHRVLIRWCQLKPRPWTRKLSRNQRPTSPDCTCAMDSLSTWQNPRSCSNHDRDINHRMEPTNGLDTENVEWGYGGEITIYNGLEENGWA